MENQQDSPPAMLCRAGCGFFGHQAFDNYCSKCYHNHQRQMQAQQQAVASSGPVANSSASLHTALNSSSTSSLTNNSSSSHNFAPSTTTTSLSKAEPPSSTAASANTNSTLSSTSDPVSIPTPPSDAATAAMLGTSPVDELNPAAASPTNGSATKTPRRCDVCKKRTGLTGFECKGCGGWHCTEHRYSDRHSCPFDYKTADRDRLRKEHPAVVGEKIQKI